VVTQTVVLYSSQNCSSLNHGESMVDITCAYGAVVSSTLCQAEPQSIAALWSVPNYD